MVADDAFEISSTRTREEFRRGLINFANQLGFGTVSAFVRIDDLNGTSRFDGVDNTPAGYLAEFHDLESGRNDPVMQHCKRASTPLAWDQTTYVEGGAAPKYERLAGFGYRSGIAMAMHLPGGRHFFLGVDRDGTLPSDSEERARLVAAVAVYTLHAQSAAARTLLPRADDIAEHMSPTPRELEVLRWTLAGKTAWDVGLILGIAERTAAIHANRASHKLGCASKHQAALKALQLGMI
jgi:DNA-binding CsgD family transcriptional regulator